MYFPSQVCLETNLSSAAMTPHHLDTKGIPVTKSMEALKIAVDSVEYLATKQKGAIASESRKADLEIIRDAITKATGGQQ